MLSSTKNNYKLVAIFASAIAAALPLWTQSARRIDFLDPSFIIVWILFGLLMSFFILFFISLKKNEMISSFIVGYMLAVIIYFVGTILLTNVIHGQFLIALSLAIVAGLISGWSGSMVWVFIKKRNRK
jgi:putative flippase GtrA